MMEDLLVTLCMSGLAVCVVMVAFSTVGLIKNDFTYRNHMIICDAIYAYQLCVLKEGRWDHVHDVTYADMEDYDDTQKRFWDWGYTRILPPEKFELIKPFINR